MKSLTKILPGISAALCAACLALLLLDALWPAWSLFLQPAVKWFLLACCASVVAASGALLARSRRLLRRKLQRARKRARG